MLLVVLVFLLPTVSDACGDPPRFETMRLQGAPKPRYRPGERIQYDCRLGFKPIIPLRSRSAVCEDDNTWSALEEACTRKSCPNLGDPMNGQVYFVNGSILFGSQAHFVCNQGFYLIGERILHCEISENNVSWNDDSPICEKILCSTPGNIKNGRFTIYKDEYQYNEIVTYVCDPSNGPDEYSLVGESRLVCVDHDRWSSDPPECKVVKCDYPVVEHGMIVSGFRRKFYYKTQVVFKCNQGFSLHGSSTIVCNANSTWEPKIPTCTQEPVAATPKPSTTHASGPRPNTTTVSSSTGLHPATTTTSSHAAYVSPTVDLEPDSFEDFDAAVIGVIILSVLIAVGTVTACLYKYSTERTERAH
ncbi:membrane cofactor protein-like isoform 3-T3 [Dama dama]|uniref:membrane cofactor protein-like isoform X3 n=1 Tax=Dama dama TaxID=30532 RepID=UPI002A371137|nr:membrane cofactor protein-like isoform X3 [Dama dama]